MLVTKVFNDSSTDIEYAAQMLNEGGVVAFPTETVYGLGALATDPQAVSKIYRAKGRPSDNPLIVHICDTSCVEMLASEIPAVFYKLALQFWGGPLTLILKKSELVPDTTTGGLDTIAIRLPSHPVALELLKRTNSPIAAPSANLSGKPSPTRAEHVISDLMGKIDGIIDGGDTIFGIESTVLDLTTPIPSILRAGVVTAEEISAVIGQQTMAVGHSNKSPGTRYSHYAPVAQLELLENICEAKSTDDTAVIMKNPGDKAGRFVLDAGTNDYEYASRLFYLLRQCDRLGVKRIYAEKPDDKGIGRAILDRLTRASVADPTIS